jgi:hypothetical protein
MRGSTRRAGEVDLNHLREEITMAIKHTGRRIREKVVTGERSEMA